MDQEFQSDLSQEEILKHLRNEMESKEAKVRLNAVKQVAGLSFTSFPTRLMLEKLAITDRSKSIRALALEILSKPLYSRVQKRASKLSRSHRKTFLAEISDWKERGLIKPEQADVLTKRYDFDSVDTVSTTLEEPAPEPTIAESSPPQEPTSRPTLIQTLLSESSIKIALYLGAFFVIASAAVLAVAVEAMRLPILLSVSIIFGISAGFTIKRLPQPSFALFVVFSFLMPTDAKVLAEILNLSSQSNALYWMVVMFVLAVVWVVGTWLYQSRLFSITAFLALILAGKYFTDLVNPAPEIYLLLFTSINFIGLGCVFLLKRWQSRKFSLPLFSTTQLGQVVLIGISFLAILDRGLSSASVWHLLTTVIYFGFAAFFVFSNKAFSFILFPWAAIIVIAPVPALFSLVFDLAAWVFSLSFLGFGLLHVLAFELSVRVEKTEINKYIIPIFSGSLIQFVTTSVLGHLENTHWGFFVLLAAAIVYIPVHITRPRASIWTISQLFGLAAYFSFFQLPMMKEVGIVLVYQILGAFLLLLLPEIFQTPDLHLNKEWRLPSRILGWIMFFILFITLVMTGFDDPGNSAICFAVLAILTLVYALRYQKAWLLYLTTGSLALGVVYVLNHFNWDAWLPVLVGLGGIFYISGLMLNRTAESWSDVLRFSGLALGALVSLIGFITRESGSGWYELGIAVLFGIELFTNRMDWMEAGIQLIGSIGVLQIRADYNIDLPYFLLGVSLFWLGVDAVIAKLDLDKRRLAWPSRSIGGLLVIINVIQLMSGSHNSVETTIVFAVYTIFFALYTYLYLQPRLLYLPSSFLSLVVIYLLRTNDIGEWVLPVTLLALVYYAFGFIIRRKETDNPWARALIFSGLGLGIITALFSPIQSSLWAVFAVALSATIFALEASHRRSVWWAIPANLLYIMSYFILLAELNVEEPQFYSVGAALLGMVMHYLLTRSGSKIGTFVAGMASQMTLLGTTYIQFVSNEEISYFAMLFFQALVVLIYGIVIRSRSLVITPVIFAVLTVFTVIFGLMQGIGTILMIGCTGIILIGLGILAVVMRERIRVLGERFTDWQA